MKNKALVYKRCITVVIFFILFSILEIHLLNYGLASLACTIHLVTPFCMVIFLSLKVELIDMIINHSLLLVLHIMYVIVIGVIGLDKLVTYRAPNWIGGFYRLGYILAIIGSPIIIVVLSIIQIGIKIIINSINRRKQEPNRKESSKGIEKID